MIHTSANNKTRTDVVSFYATTFAIRDNDPRENLFFKKISRSVVGTTTIQEIRDRKRYNVKTFARRGARAKRVDDRI